MFGKLSAFWDLFQAGKEVADASKWKAHQITATMLAAVFMAIVSLLKGYGYDLPISQDVAMEIASGFIAVVNVVLTIVTSKRVGFSGSSLDVPAATVQPSVQDVPVVQPEPEKTAQEPTKELTNVWDGKVQHFDFSKVEEAKRLMDADRDKQIGG